MRFDFEWYPRKAKQNAEKHGVTFEQATGVFRDPRALSVYDANHGENEGRWVTLGICSTGALLVVHHTYEREDADAVVIRIISSRKATRKEHKHYTE